MSFVVAKEKSSASNKQHIVSKQNNDITLDNSLVAHATSISPYHFPLPLPFIQLQEYPVYSCDQGTRCVVKSNDINSNDTNLIGYSAMQPNPGANGDHNIDNRNNISEVHHNIQTKLKVSQPGDDYEQEADRVAEQVMRMPSLKQPYFSTISDDDENKKIGRKCKSCEDEEDSEKFKISRKENSYLSNRVEASENAAIEISNTKGQSGSSLDTSTREFMESRFGYDFTNVRIHTNDRAAKSAKSVNALAYTTGNDIIFDYGKYDPYTDVGKKLLAHELTHVIQEDITNDTMLDIYRYGDPIPRVPNPTVTTMRQFIDLVLKIESANPGKSNLEIAQMIMRAKYHSQGFDYLLPSSSSTSPITALGTVTQNDITTLSGEFTVTLPQGGQSDPTHVIVSIVAGAERQVPGAGGAGGLSSRLVSALPPGLTQLDVASWAGDPASAAAEWMTAHPHPNGGTTMQHYMDEFSPESDMIADIDGVAMTSKSSSFGFVFDFSRPLSENLERFYYPSSGKEGKNRRFHTFCAVLGFQLEPDGVTLSSSAISMIDNRIKANADWFTKNDPNILSWMTLNTHQTSPSYPGNPGGFSQLFNPVPREWVRRANDWIWFAQKFRDFVQRNLNAEAI
jgi:hypothetical protein